METTQAKSCECKKEKDFSWQEVSIVAILAILAAIWLTNCSSAPTTPSPDSVPKTERPVKGWPAAYDEYIKAKVTPSLLAAKLDFCPRYETMSEADKRVTWAQILHGIAIPESGLDRTEQFKEPGMKDSAGNQVYSEGLLQLSYQDAKNYPMAKTCQEFDYAKDLGKPLADRSIMDPYINLGCGLEIMDRLLTRFPGSAVESLGKYWSTIRRNKCDARTWIRKNSTCGQEPGGC